MDCKTCGSSEWQKVHEDSKTGHKGPANRNDTAREVYECESCGKEGRKFTDGVTGNITHSGAMRQ